MRHLICLGVASSVLLASPPAKAGDFDDCWDKTGQAAVGACSRLIASGSYSGEALGKIYTARSFHYLALNNLPAVIDDCNRALAINARDPVAWHNRSVAKGRNGDNQGALADVDQAIRVKPDYYNAFVQRGLLYERLGNLEQARASFRVAAGAPAIAANQRAIARAREGLGRLGQ